MMHRYRYKGGREKGERRKGRGMTHRKKRKEMVRREYE